MALLIAILLTGSALLVAVGISSLILGQINLSQSSRESHAALFAAQAGIECALYYDNRYAPASPGFTLWDATSGNPCDWTGAIGTAGGADAGSSTPSGPPTSVTCNLQCLGLQSQIADPGAGSDYLTDVRGTRTQYTAPTPDPNDTEVNEYEFRFSLRRLPAVLGGPVWNRSPGICTEVTIISTNTKASGTNVDRVRIISNGKSSCDTRLPRVNRNIEFEYTPNRT